MNILNPEYNIVKIAGSTLGYKHTPESIEKMRGRGGFAEPPYIK